ISGLIPKAIKLSRCGGEWHLSLSHTHTHTHAYRERERGIHTHNHTHTHTQWTKCVCVCVSVCVRLAGVELERGSRWPCSVVTHKGQSRSREQRSTLNISPLVARAFGTANANGAHT